jgi:flagellar basal body-associated protein FliL
MQEMQKLRLRQALNVSLPVVQKTAAQRVKSQRPSIRRILFQHLKQQSLHRSHPLVLDWPNLLEQ